LYASPNIIRVIESRMIRWVKTLEDLGVDGKIILEWTLGK